MTATNWPDPARPGVPLNPERDGWHWLDSFNREKTIVFWHGENQGNEGHWEGYPLWIAQDWIYLGPVLLPDEATALQARADRNAAGFARVDAEAERAKFLHKQEIAALQKRVAELEAKLNLLMGPPPDKVSLRAGMIAAGVSEKTADEILRSPTFNRAAAKEGKP